MHHLKTKTAYVGVKIRGLDHFVWFEHGKYWESATDFAGCDGWGLNGALTHLGGAVDQIEARIHSDALQYS